jgi:glycolate oxidase FAD binding subunit
VTALRSTVARLFGAMSVEADGVPEADFVFAPPTVEDAARILDFASEHRLPVLPWGGGTHQGMGGRFDPGIVMLSAGLDRVVDWQPDDLTVVVEAGVRLDDLEATLTERGQSVMASEAPGDGTIGGMVAAGVSGWRRLRYGPVRERMLEVLLATGDGRVVRAGGRVVKNVTGYDIPRLVTGSFGSLGMVAQVCLKLWPVDAVSATVRSTIPEQRGSFIVRWQCSSTTGDAPCTWAAPRHRSRRRWNCWAVAQSPDSGGRSRSPIR